MELTGEAVYKAKTKFRENYVRLVSAVDALEAGNTRDRLDSMVDDIAEPVSNWLGYDPLVSGNIDLWVKEGRRLIVVMTRIGQEMPYEPIVITAVPGLEPEGSSVGLIFAVGIVLAGLYYAAGD